MAILGEFENRLHIAFSSVASLNFSASVNRHRIENFARVSFFSVFTVFNFVYIESCSGLLQIVLQA